MGERPAILSRGYGRRDAVDGVVVVRDPDGIRADLDRAGDEPLMLARQLDGVAVVVCPDRHLAGRLAEHHFGCTVHVLDDGFQHFTLRRDADIVVVTNADVPPKGGSYMPQTFPAGRLREPIDALAAADAVIHLEAGSRTLEAESWTREAGSRKLDTGSGKREAGSGKPEAGSGKREAAAPFWRAKRVQLPVRAADPASPPVVPGAGPILAVAGIANPDGFFADLRAAGWTIARDLRFRDHHRYSPADMKGLEDAARASGARAIVTTEKDLVRLLPFRPFRVAVGCAPMAIELESPGTFDAWLMERVHAARQAS